MAHRRNYYAMNILRLKCILFMMLSSFQLPFVIFSYIEPVLRVAPCVLFTISGFFIFRENIVSRFVDFRRYIRRALLVFIGVFAFCLPSMIIIQRYLTGEFPEILNKRTIFEFVVLNIWPSNIGSEIWIVQAALYAFVILSLLDKLKLLRFDKILVPLLFIIATVLGEATGYVHFNFLGYSIIPGNFLTRALPYMLLGKIIADNRQRIRNVPSYVWHIILVLSIAAFYFEIVGLSNLGKLTYTGHFISFIPMTFSMVCLAVSMKTKAKRTPLDSAHRRAAFIMYASYSTIGYGLLALAYYLRSNFLYNFLEFLTPAATILIAFGYSFLRMGIKSLWINRKRLFQRDVS